MLESFVKAPITDPSVPPSFRGWFEEPRRAAELILRLSGPDGTSEDERELAELMVAPRLSPWHCVKHDVDQQTKWTDERVPVTANEKRHKRVKTVAENAVRGWIGSPAVAREVEGARARLNSLVDPLVLPDQLTVTLVSAHFLGGAGYYPDGSEWSNPFDGAPEDVRSLAERIQPAFIDALKELGRRIEAAGVRLDPDDPGVLLVLAQLTLLDSNLSRPASEIVSRLNIWPPGYVDREAASHGQVATWSSRHGRSARFQADLAASAEAVARRLGPPPIRPPYSGGQKRATRSDTVALKRALAILVERDRSLTSSTLLGFVNGEEHPAFKTLRQALGKDDRWLPDRRRIDRLWPTSRH